jgi:hypothetical protein
VPSQQLQDHLQTQHNVDTLCSNTTQSQRQITGKHWRKNELMQKSKQINGIIIIIIISLSQIEVIIEN